MTENTIIPPEEIPQENENELLPLTELPLEKEPEMELPPSKMGFNLLHWLGLLALIGLIILYVLFFLYKASQENKVPVPQVLSSLQKNGLTIAFVNSDSLRSHYQLVKDLERNLQEKYSSMSADISNRQKALENKASEFQSKYESNQISLEEAQRADESLKAEGQKLYQLNQQYSDKMASEESRLNEVYVDSINNFLKRLNTKYNFDYILGYSKGGGILFARDTLDITPFVLEGLNKEYVEKYPEAKEKSK